MAIFGRNTARQRLRRAAEESLKIPAFRSPVDCAPWVTGGLWPAELSTLTAETAPLVKYLKADLQRIVNSANEDLKNIRCAGLTDSTRQAEEARVIDEARAFAVRRVESTVRHLHNLTSAPPPGYRPVDYADTTENTPRFKLSPPKPDPEPITEATVVEDPEAAAPIVETPAVEAPEAVTPIAEAPAVEAPAVEAPEAAAPENPAPWQGEPEPFDPWEPSDLPEPIELVPREEPVAQDPVFTRPLPEPEPRAPEPEPVKSAPRHARDADDTEVLEQLSSLLHEIGPLTPPPLESPPPAGDAEITRQLPTIEPSGPTAPSETDRERLERLLKFIARQEPGLRWAVGVHDDGSTLLVTDFAHGWIPPGVELPGDVRLLKPARRKGTASALLGPTTLKATYAPGDPLGWATDCVVSGTSSNPRELPPVDDLGWVLGEATHWRDGLPRMVNTLAKAGAAGTGIVDAEIDILRVYLDTARYQMLAQYPDVDQGLMLNCLLLAATEAIATNDPVSANYHFAWFQSLSSPPANDWQARP